MALSMTEVHCPRNPRKMVTATRQTRSKVSLAVTNVRVRVLVLVQCTMDCTHKHNPIYEVNHLHCGRRPFDFPIQNSAMISTFTMHTLFPLYLSSLVPFMTYRNIHNTYTQQKHNTSVPDTNQCKAICSTGYLTGMPRPGTLPYCGVSLLSTTSCL